MATICPTINAYNEADYKAQIENVQKFAQRIQIDLADGKFTKEESIKPEQAWWPEGILADFHLMFQEPLTAVKTLADKRPNLIIIQAEAGGSLSEAIEACKSKSVKLGLALMQKTPVDHVLPVLDQLSHVLIFSGNLGYQGGSHADLTLLDKVKKIKEAKPSIEVGWDGGVNDQNISALIDGQVDVLNVGGYIQQADNPERNFHILQRIADETGTT